jgi:hypothetical protein
MVVFLISNLCPILVVISMHRIRWGVVCPGKVISLCKFIGTPAAGKMLQFFPFGEWDNFIYIYIYINILLYFYTYMYMSIFIYGIQLGVEEVFHVRKGILYTERRAE